ncbi:hypothetical protein [Brasilonema sennae]|uniref:hypothetical protein n=1 Tax=Brasilonema sennae TaxID=1397703 RepID=UPI00155A4331|nr:hypothetical protein [Brasilonema sennae]
MKRLIIIMLKRNLLIVTFMSFLILISMTIVQTPASSSNSFPQNWQGTWSGTMFNSPVQGRSQTVPMTLRIQPISNNPMRYSWQITYGTGAKKLVRNYELVAKDQGASHFVIDEKDGTLIDAWWVGDRLYSQFRVKNRLLNTQYERQSNRLHYELVTYQSVSSAQGENEQQKVPFESYQLQVVQSAELSLAK